MPLLPPRSTSTKQQAADSSPVKASFTASNLSPVAETAANRIGNANEVAKKANQARSMVVFEPEPDIPAPQQRVGEWVPAPARFSAGAAPQPQSTQSGKADLDIPNLAPITSSVVKKTNEAKELADKAGYVRRPFEMLRDEPDLQRWSEPAYSSVSNTATTPSQQYIPSDTSAWSPGPDNGKPERTVAASFDFDFAEPDDSESPDLAPLVLKGDLPRTNYFGDEMRPSRRTAEPANFYAGTDRQSAYAGNTPTNDAYIRDAIEHGLSDDEANDIMNGDGWWARAAGWWGRLGNVVGQGLHAGERSGPLMYNDDIDLSSNFSTIDDGSSYDYNHMTADSMTGTQYMHYVEMGMGGLPIEQIDPTQIYSKRNEMLNNGFIPFTPDLGSVASYELQNMAGRPGRLATSIGHGRNIISHALGNDYMITYGTGGDRKTINGHDFDALASAYINQTRRNDHLDPYHYVVRPADMSNVTPIVVEFAIPSNAGTVYAHGMLSESPRYTESGSILMSFTDGQQVEVPASLVGSILDDEGNLDIDVRTVPAPMANGWLPDNLDSLNDMGLIESRLEASDLPNATAATYAGVSYYPDMVMYDGMRIPYSDVERIYYDQDLGDNPDRKDDDDIVYDMDFLNRPSRLMQQQLFSDDGGFNRDFFGNGNAITNVTDWTLGSIPISIPGVLPWVGAASNATMSMKGADPGMYNPATNTYGLIGGYYDNEGNLRYGITDSSGNVDDRRGDEYRIWNTIGNAAVPATEMIAGDIGSDPIKKVLYRWFPNLTPSVAPTLGRYLANGLIGMGGEAYEEVIGNYFDEATSYGPDAFLSPVYDSNGNIMRDIAGREIRDYDTSGLERAGNLWQAAAGPEGRNAAFGGAAVDMMMNLIPGVSENGWAPLEAVYAARRSAANAAARRAGIEPFVEPVPQQIRPSFIDLAGSEVNPDTTNLDEDDSDAYDSVRYIESGETEEAKEV